MIDFPGRLAAVFFISGCTFSCGFCHNARLMAPRRKGVEWQKLESICEGFRSHWVDAAVITGGEPTSAPDLIDLIGFFKELGWTVKLDTNGYFPEKLKKAIDGKLVSYIAMDVKAPLNEDEYSSVAGVDGVDVSRISRSINLIKDSGVDYEFRTTVCPVYINSENIVEVAKAIEGAKKYSLQQFSPKECYSKSMRDVKPYSREIMYDMKRIVEPYVKNCVVKGV